MERWAKLEEIDRYNALALEIVRSEGIPVDDLHRAILENDFTQCLSADGCHMTERGNQALSDAVARAVLELGS